MFADLYNLVGGLPVEKNNITGKVFTRSYGPTTTPADGRELFLLMGLLAAPPETFESEHLNIAGGRIVDGGKMIVLANFGTEDVSKISIGNSISGILTSPIWRY